MTYALVQGVLFKDPESRTSRSGNPFTMATIRAKDGDAFVFWKVFCFSESQQGELGRLRAGDALACQGSFRAEIYVPPGAEPRVSLTMTADQVLALKQPPKQRKPKESDAGQGDGYSRSGAPNRPAPVEQPAPRPQRAPGDLDRYDPGPADRDLDDTIPF